MNTILLESVPADNLLDVSDWLRETRDGKETRSLCVYYDRFGFGMSLEQVQEAVAKLDTLLTHNGPSESSGEIQVDRSGTDDPCIMIAFRPDANHSCRYFDFPEDTARDLLVRLQKMLARADCVCSDFRGRDEPQRCD
ncbi:MAG: hypothetical protein ACLP9L_04150 [Thermoguttaceae bacterium]